MVAIFEKKEYSSEYIYDDSGEKVFSEYFKKQDDLDKKIVEKIDKMVETQIPIIIWGIGAFFMRIWENSELEKTNIVAFIDKNPIKVRDLKLGDKRIISPEILLEQKLKGTIVVFCAKDSNSIIKDINAMGIDNDVIVV